LQLVFGNIPSIEAKIKVRGKSADIYRFVVADLTSVQRLETSAIELLEREAREKVETRALVFSGVSPDSPVYADLLRGGLRLNFGAQWIKDSTLEMLQRGPIGFERCANAIEWCKSQIDLGMPAQSLNKEIKKKGKFYTFLPGQDW